MLGRFLNGSAPAAPPSLRPSWLKRILSSHRRLSNRMSVGQYPLSPPQAVTYLWEPSNSVVTNSHLRGVFGPGDLRSKRGVKFAGFAYQSPEPDETD